MAVRAEQIVLALDGTVQRLTTALPGTRDGDIKIREISIQARATNTNPVYVGFKSDMSDTDYAVRLPAPVDSVPAAPWMQGDFEDGSMHLGDYYVKGTNGEYLQIGILRFI